MDVFSVDGWRRRFRLALLPARCLICAERGSNGLDLCARCAQALPFNPPACLQCALALQENSICGACLRAPPPLSVTHAAFRYDFPVNRLIPRLKFHHDLAAGRLLSELMTAAWSAAKVDIPMAFIPVPLHARRLRERGYDQALELARPLAANFSRPLLTDVLVRVRQTTAQSQLDAEHRRANLRNAFAVVGNVPEHVVLFDDVMTTGATLHAAARALHRAGVRRVDAWVCARVP